MTQNTSPVESRHFLGRVDAELRRCGDLLSRIEEEVLPLISKEITPSLRAALQDIDLLSQCIDDISRAVQGFAMGPSAADAIDLAPIMATIRLQDMRIRLEGGTFDSRKLTDRADMFDQPAKPAIHSHELF